MLHLTADKLHHLLERAQHATVILENGPVKLKKLTAAEAAEIKKSHARNDQMTVAKKWVKFLEASHELDRACGAAALDSHVVPRAAAASLDPAMLQLVPVATAKTVKPPTSEARSKTTQIDQWRPLLNLMLAYRNSSVWQFYRRAWSLTLAIVFYMPLVVLWVLFVYVILFFFYVAQHPGELVHLFFKALNLVPAYTAYAGKEMFLALGANLGLR